MYRHSYSIQKPHQGAAFSRRAASLLLVTCCALLFTQAAPAATITVKQDGTGDYTSIQRAVHDRLDGDEIVVYPGRYVENINFSERFSSRYNLPGNVILRSLDPSDPGIVASTIIDGGQNGSAVTFSGDEGSTCVLMGFTITNGGGEANIWNDEKRFGGGIDGNGTHATIKNNIFENNDTRGYFYYDYYPFITSKLFPPYLPPRYLRYKFSFGGGIYDCHGLIENNIIRNCYADSGGGISECDGTIRNNIISDNVCEKGGGLANCNGMVLYNTINNNRAEVEGGGGLYSCNGVIDSNRIYDNEAGVSGGRRSGGALLDCDGLIINNTIFDNKAGFGGGLNNCGGLILNNTIANNSADKAGGGLYQCIAKVQNCIFWNNISQDGVSQLSESSTPTFSLIQNWTGGGEGNIEETPMFVDEESRDFHLSANSPCIDAGITTDNLEIDYEGDARPKGISADIGADEFLGTEGAFLFVSNPNMISKGFFGGPFKSASHTILVQNRSAFENLEWSVDSTSEWLTIQPNSEILEPWSKASITISINNFANTLNSQLYQTDIVFKNRSNGSGNTARTLYLWIKSFENIIEISGEHNNRVRIQSAIDLADEGTEIIVPPGTYNENLKIKGKNIVLRSGNPLDSSIVQRTIISPIMSGPAISFSGTEGATCRFSGFTLINGFNPSGGGVSGNGTLAEISYNIIKSNHATNRGGGLYSCDGYIHDNIISNNATTGYGGGLYHCNGIIENNTVERNVANYGAGFYGGDGILKSNKIFYNVAMKDGGGLLHYDGTIVSNVIRNNIAQGIGGGLRSCAGSILNNVITHNKAESHGGISDAFGGQVRNNIISYNSNGGIYSSRHVKLYSNVISYNTGAGVVYCRGDIINNLIYNNSGDDGGGISKCEGNILNNTIYNNSAISKAGGISESVGIIRNCIIWGNKSEQVSNQIADLSTTPTYSVIQDWDNLTSGNIKLDPMFVDPENGDFHLLPGSPCIDAGGTVTLALDFDGEARPFDGDGLGAGFTGDGSEIDIGADEFAPGPYNMRQHIAGRIDFPEHFTQALDINGDGAVDIADIVRFMRDQQDAAQASESGNILQSILDGRSDN